MSVVIFDIWALSPERQSARHISTIGLYSAIHDSSH